VLGAVAQFEKAVIVSKLKAARQRKKRATGRCEGRKPYGSRPGEADVVDYIRKLRLKPKGGERSSFGDRGATERRGARATGRRGRRRLFAASLSAAGEPTPRPRVAVQPLATDE
jgi:hypothetical protein